MKFAVLIFLITEEEASTLTIKTDLKIIKLILQHTGKKWRSKVPSTFLHHALSFDDVRFTKQNI